MPTTAGHPVKVQKKSTLSRGDALTFKKTKRSSTSALACSRRGSVARGRGRILRYQLQERRKEVKAGKKVRTQRLLAAAPTRMPKRWILSVGLTRGGNGEVRNSAQTLAYLDCNLLVLTKFLRSTGRVSEEGHETRLGVIPPYNDQAQASPCAHSKTEVNNTGTRRVLRLVNYDTQRIVGAGLISGVCPFSVFFLLPLLNPES